MNILLCNDDGIFSEGLKSLANILKREHNVTVVAPSGNRSGYSRSISFYKDLEVAKVDAIEGVDSDFLKDKLCMKEPAIIIAYAILLDDPKEISEYFKHLSENRVGFYPHGK